MKKSSLTLLLLVLLLTVSCVDNNKAIEIAQDYTTKNVLPFFPNAKIETTIYTSDNYAYDVGNQLTTYKKIQREKYENELYSSYSTGQNTLLKNMDSLSMWIQNLNTDFNSPEWKKYEEKRKELLYFEIGNEITKNSYNNLKKAKLQKRFIKVSQLVTYEIKKGEKETMLYDVILTNNLKVINTKIDTTKLDVNKLFFHKIQ